LSTPRALGISFRNSCSCRLIVWVEIMILRRFSRPKSNEGIRYARDLPTPVPASTTRCWPSLRERAIALAISCCSRRYSKFGCRDSAPDLPNVLLTDAMKSLSKSSFNAITLSQSVQGATIYRGWDTHKCEAPRLLCYTISWQMPGAKRHTRLRVTRVYFTACSVF